MHVAGQIERRINQLYNDVHAIYDQLSAVEKVQKAHTEQLGTLNSTVADIWTTQQQHGDKLNSLDAAIAVISERLTAHDGRFTSIDQRFTSIDQRFEAIDQRFTSIDQRFDAQDEQLNAHGKQLETQDRKLDLIMEALGIGAN